nr:DUF397 domain-containing protein [Acrocarpospora corrugata]
MQVAVVGGRVVVRDSKKSRWSCADLAPGEWRAFAGGVRLGEFDLPA